MAVRDCQPLPDLGVSASEFAVVRQAVREDGIGFGEVSEGLFFSEKLQRCPLMTGKSLSNRGELLRDFLSELCERRQLRIGDVTCIVRMNQGWSDVVPGSAGFSLVCGAQNSEVRPELLPSSPGLAILFFRANEGSPLNAHVGPRCVDVQNTIDATERRCVLVVHSTQLPRHVQMLSSGGWPDMMPGTVAHTLEPIVLHKLNLPTSRQTGCAPRQDAHGALKAAIAVLPETNVLEDP